MWNTACPVHRHCFYSICYFCELIDISCKISYQFGRFLKASVGLLRGREPSFVVISGDTSANSRMIWPGRLSAVTCFLRRITPLASALLKFEYRTMAVWLMSALNCFFRCGGYYGFDVFRFPMCNRSWYSSMICSLWISLEPFGVLCRQLGCRAVSKVLGFISGPFIFETNRRTGSKAKWRCFQGYRNMDCIFTRPVSVFPESIYDPDLFAEAALFQADSFS